MRSTTDKKVIHIPSARASGKAFKWKTKLEKSPYYGDKLVKAWDSFNPSVPFSYLVTAREAALGRD